MAGLDGEDRAGGSEVRCAHDVRRSTEVGAYAHAFEDGGGRNEAQDVGDGEAVLAGSDGGHAGFCEGGGQE